MSFDPYKKKGYNVPRGENNTYRKKETVNDIKKYPIAYNKERKISKETCKYFGVRMSLCEEDGTTITAYYFPYYDQQGKITGYKKTDLTLDKYDKYYFTAIGRVGLQSKLFGQHQSEKIDRKRKKLIITEGEWDVLAGFEAIKKQAEGTKWEDLDPFIVGLSCGTKNAEDACINNNGFISEFEVLALAMDNDFATEKDRKNGIMRGLEATEAVASLYLDHDVRVLSYAGTEGKDLSDVLKNDRYTKLSSMLSFGFKKFVAEKVVTAEDIGFENFVKERPEGIYVNAFPKLMDKIHGFRKRELVVVTAPSGAGKSSCTSEIAFSLSEQRCKVGQIFLEEETSETLQRMCARYLKVNYTAFSKNPRKYATEEELKEAYEWACSEERFVFLDHFGSIKIEELMNKIKTFVFKHKRDFIILDHLSMLVSGLGTDKERGLIDQVMTELAAFVASHDVGIIAVCHLNRSVAEEFKAPKGQENKPFWVNVRKEALKGSSSLEQLSWIILGLEPEIMPDKSRGRVRWSVLKNRPWSRLGRADTFQMDEDTGLLELAEDEIAEDY